MTFGGGGSALRGVGADAGADGDAGSDVVAGPAPGVAQPPAINASALTTRSERAFTTSDDKEDTRGDQ